MEGRPHWLMHAISTWLQARSLRYQAEEVRAKEVSSESRRVKVQPQCQKKDVRVVADPSVVTGQHPFGRPIRNGETMPPLPGS